MRSHTKDPLDPERDQDLDEPLPEAQPDIRPIRWFPASSQPLGRPATSLWGRQQTHSPSTMGWVSSFGKALWPSPHGPWLAAPTRGSRLRCWSYFWRPAPPALSPEARAPTNEILFCFETTGVDSGF